MIGDFITHVFGEGAADKVRAFFTEVQHWFDELGKKGKVLETALGGLAFVITSKLLSALGSVLGPAKAAGDAVGAAGAAAKGSGGLFRAAALDVAALGAAYEEWQQLSSETGGLGVVGAFKRSLQRGKGIFEAIDSHEDEEAKKRRAQQDANDKYNEEHPEVVRHGVTLVKHVRGRGAVGRAGATPAPPAAPPAWLATVLSATPRVATSPNTVTNVHNTTHIESKPNIVITVPPGTSRQQARDIGNGAEQGTRRGLDGIDLRATKSALVPTAG